MIIVRLMGGHSNQLFQYALGRRRAKELNTELVLDLSWFKDFADVDTPRFYELGCYQLQASTRENLQGIRVIDPRQPIGRLAKTLRKLHIGNAIWEYHEQGQGFNPEALMQPDNTMYIGFWLH